MNQEATVTHLGVVELATLMSKPSKKVLQEREERERELND
jgi:hypothetical protein